MGGAHRRSYMTPTTYPPHARDPLRPCYHFTEFAPRAPPKRGTATVHRVPPGLLAALIVTAATGLPAFASVQVRVGVRPDSLEHCEHGLLAFSLWNDGADTIRVRITASLTYADSVNLGPIMLRTRLAPHEVRHRDADFVVPPGIPEGGYALRVEAVGSDSSRAGATAHFEVLTGGCSGDPGESPMPLLEDVAQGMGLDIPTPAVNTTWGGLKRRYDGNPH